MSSSKKHLAYIGPILRKMSDDNLYVFSIGFNDKEKAQKYKDMFTWIIADDKYKINNKMGVFDRKEFSEHKIREDG